LLSFSYTLAGIIFLIIEQKNDYVRFHAWQSCLIFAIMIVRASLSLFFHVTAVYVILTIFCTSCFTLSLFGRWSSASSWLFLMRSSSVS